MQPLASQRAAIHAAWAASSKYVNSISGLSVRHSSMFRFSAAGVSSRGSLCDVIRRFGMSAQAAAAQRTAYFIAAMAFAAAPCAAVLWLICCARMQRITAILLVCSTEFEV